MDKPGIAQPCDILVCAFCGGQGTDPFNCLSSRSVCGSCQGTGLREVPVPHAKCAYCLGRGSYKTYRCPICGGAGEIPLPHVPTRTCPECLGQAFDRSSGLTCLACHGTGRVTSAGEPES